MLKKRVIFTLLYDDEVFMLSRNFRLQKVGDLNWLKKNYNFSHISLSIDELIILDVSRGKRNEDKFCEHVCSLTEECFIPIAAGGGIREVVYARKLLQSGADKVVVNSLVALNKNMIVEIASEFGSQCIVVAIDVKKEGDEYTVWTESGSNRNSKNLREWLLEVKTLPVGEVYLNSMDKDGTGQGFYSEMLNSIPDDFTIPVILAGGAGNYNHLQQGLDDCRVDAVATANLFNFIGDGLQDARMKLIEGGYQLPKWDIDVTASLKSSVMEKS